MNEQPEALRLAEWLVIRSNGPMDARHKAAAELRRLHEKCEALQEEIDELRAAIKTRSQKLAEAGYRRRPSAKSLPSDE